LDKGEFSDDERKYKPYWVNSSTNVLLDTLIKKGNAALKMQFEELIKGNCIKSFIDEEIIYTQLWKNQEAVWSFMLSVGYLKVEKVETVGRFNKELFTLRLPNLEVEGMVNGFIGRWFTSDNTTYYNDFVKSLLLDDVESMNEFMNGIALNSFSGFDVSKNASSSDALESFTMVLYWGLW
jgi:hypothetical protein